MKWTEEQEQAIYSDGKNILVSAAAGSGKTAVLVERIIQKVLSKESPTNIDALLVVTFTNAAAEEMRSRVSLALEEALANDPTSLHLKKQLSFVQQASISTLHSFCMDTIRQYAYLLDIDPAFRVANEMEADLLQQEVLDDLFEEWYDLEGEERDLFFTLVDMFSNDRSDLDVEALILKLYTFAMQNPWPDKWLDELASQYEMNENESLDDLEWLSIVKEEVKMNLDVMEQLIEEAKGVCESTDGPIHYLETLAADEEMLRVARENIDDWDALQAYISTAGFKRLSSKRMECAVEKKDEVKAIRGNYQKRWNNMKEKLFARDLTSHLLDMQTLAPYIRLLANLVKEFKKEFTNRKIEQAIVDFSDLEHYCLQILRDESSTAEQLVPSSVAMNYRKKFSEVLIDEYQDTNLVQETILQLVSRPEDGGNLFMVGDVKQSIYGFRHAEPTLFINKYNTFQRDPDEGMRIDLAKNFRSREHVLSGVNYIFRQILDEEVGDIAYDSDAELIYGNKMYDELPLDDKQPELLFIHDETESDEDSTSQEADSNYLNLEKVQLEARAYGEKIKEWIGRDSNQPMQVYDKHLEKQRGATYKDIVILLRSINDAPVMMEELKKQGIPTYAELPSGYFDAIEVKVMLSLLKVIDNPRQDIPLASVLRSPIVGLNEEDLAKVRLAERQGNYYEALILYEQENSDLLASKLKQFLKQLNKFRQLAKRGALSELIWEIYRETAYYDFVGGIAGGKQRQANLRALYDRARTYEETSFRGLFRFLRFIERMEERDEDLGAARGLSEQEDVVRITTIHKSKGLEYPIVIVGRLDKQFNFTDLREKYLLDKDYGFATKFIDPVKRITYPTLYYYALQIIKKREQLAEEMRVLYVALTRAREKLLMVASPKTLEKELENWQGLLSHPTWVLPKDLRMDAKSYIDWIGPSLVRHANNDVLQGNEGSSGHITQEIFQDNSQWKITFMSQKSLAQLDEEEKEVAQKQLKESIKQWKVLDISNEKIEAEVSKRLSYDYPHEEVTRIRAKQSVTEIKRMQEEVDSFSATDIVDTAQTVRVKEPLFLQKKRQVGAAEKGTAMHTVMQHLPFDYFLEKKQIPYFINDLVDHELLTRELAQTIDPNLVTQFYKSEVAELLQKASNIYREVPFSLTIDAKDIYLEDIKNDEEKVLIQGVIDCIIPYGDGWLILDYKTDFIAEEVDEEIKNMLKERYRVQMELYKKAVESIWGRHVNKIYLYFFSKDLLLEV